MNVGVILYERDREEKNDDGDKEAQDSAHRIEVFRFGTSTHSSGR